MRFPDKKWIFLKIDMEQREHLSKATQSRSQSSRCPTLPYTIRLQLGGIGVPTGGWSYEDLQPYQPLHWMTSLLLGIFWNKVMNITSYLTTPASYPFTITMTLGRVLYLVACVCCPSLYIPGVHMGSYFFLFHSLWLCYNMCGYIS